MCPRVGQSDGGQKETATFDTDAPPQTGASPQEPVDKPPTKVGAVVGGISGVCVGLGSHILLLDSVIVSTTLSLLYGIGVTLLVDYLRLLRETPSDDGSWWTIVFGGIVGLVLMVVQQFVPRELMNVTWLLVFGVALASLVCGIGMAVGDLSEY